MGEFFKKNLWILDLIALGIIAWMLGAVTSEGVGAFIASRVQKMKAKASLPKVKGKVVAAIPSTDLSGYAQVRNPFDSDRPKEEAEGEEGEDSEGGEDTSTGEGPEEADIGITLLGTLYSPGHPEWSLATIKDGADTVIVKEGSKVLSDTAEVVRIAQRYIVVKKGKKEYVVRLWTKKDSSRKGLVRRRPGFLRPIATAGPVPSWRRKNYRKGVRKVGPYEYQVDRDMIMQELQDLSALGMQARIIPNYRNGKYEGFRLVGVRPNSLYSALGIRSGDIVKRVNGQDLNSPNKALELFNQLQTASTITVDVTRYGKNITLTYKVK